MTDKTMTITNLDRMSEEAYKVFRSNIEFLQVDKKYKTLTLTSCIPNEGKSTTAYYLGLSIAQNGARVVVVDADLRKPAYLKEMKGDNAKGLSNYILGRATMDEILTRTAVRNLYFINCGVKPPNPVELLSSQRFRDFVAAVSEQFDIVIFDTPPLGSVIDAAVIASKTDATILVIQPKKVDYKLAQTVKDQLEKAKANIIGVVLNRVEKRRNRKDEYYYYSSIYDDLPDGLPSNQNKRWRRRSRRT